MQSNLSVVGNLINLVGAFAATTLFAAAVRCELSAGTPFWVSSAACVVGFISFCTAAEPAEGQATGFKSFADVDA
jgi:hypothetical protein